jgi:hypothetical protein
VEVTWASGPVNNHWEAAHAWPCSKSFISIN